MRPVSRRTRLRVMQIFDLTPQNPLGQSISHAVAHPLATVEFRNFAGGQHKIRPMTSVRGEDVFVISCLHDTDDLSVNDNMIRMLFFIAACRDHGAARVTAIVPWLPYARKDRVTKPHDPVSSRYTAQLFEAVGTETLITVDVHNLAAFQNGFRCRTINIEGLQLLSDEVADRAGDAPVTILSPDLGGAKRAELVRQAVETVRGKPTGFAVVEKHRSAGLVGGTLFAGKVDGHDVWIVDDMIESGETMLRAAEACRQRGARSVHLMATHALCDVSVLPRLLGPTVSSLTVTNTAKAITLQAPDDRLRIRDVGPLVGEYILRICQRQPSSPLPDKTEPTR